MTRSNIRRAAALLSGAVTAGLLLSGCGAGQDAETANKVPAIYGVDAELRTDNGYYKVRDAAVLFAEGGYTAGGNAPLQVTLFNDTDEPVTVRVSSDAAEGVRLVDPNATPSPSPSESEAPSESPSASPSEGEAPSESPAASPSEVEPSEPAAPAGPATIEIPANGFVLLNQADGPRLELVGLREALTAGAPVTMSFDFGGQVLETPIGLAVPLTPLPRPSPVNEGVEGGEGSEGH